MKSSVLMILISMYFTILPPLTFGTVYTFEYSGPLFNYNIISPFTESNNVVVSCTTDHLLPPTASYADFLSNPNFFFSISDGINLLYSTDPTNISKAFAYSLGGDGLPNVWDFEITSQNRRILSQGDNLHSGGDYSYQDVDGDGNWTLVAGMSQVYAPDQQRSWSVVESGEPVPIVPEPASFLLLASGMAGLVAVRKRRFFM